MGICRLIGHRPFRARIIGKIQMSYLMTAPSEMSTQTGLERMTGIVVDDTSHRPGSRNAITAVVIAFAQLISPNACQKCKHFLAIWFGEPPGCFTDQFS